MERARASLAEKKGAAKDRLLAIAASESSATANGLLGWTQALRRGFANQSAREHVFSLMEARITSHLLLLETLLDASGASAGVELSLVRLSLLDVVESAIDSQRGFADERGVRLCGVRPLAASAVVFADRPRIARALEDLLAECIRAAELESTIEVALTSGADFAAVRLTVTRRTTLDEASVGVVGARHAAKVHLGALESDRDGFLLRLPLFDPAGVPTTPNPVKTILVVRHEQPDIAEMLAGLATARGHRVLTVHDEELAARAFALHAPDVVVVGSPDGVDRLRAFAESVTGRVVMISSAADARELVKTLGGER